MAPPILGGGRFIANFAGKSASFTCKCTCTHLGLFARLITLFSISSMVLLQHACVFLLEIPRIEELQDSNSSPRRGEVGRPTLRDYGGFLLSFFYRARFQLFTQQFPMFVEKLQKLSPRSLQTPSE